MFDKLKKQLYFTKFTLLIDEGKKNNKIVPFDNDFYEKMSHNYIDGIPISMYIKYLKPIISPGKCYDRSLYMFFCFPEAKLCGGNNKSLALQYGKEYSEHNWIEIDDYVYDPVSLMRFNKDLYYRIYEPTNVVKETLSEYCSTPEKKKFYEDITNTTIYDLQTSIKKRNDLLTSIPPIKGIAEMTGNKDFIRELNEHLKLINYDEQQILNELDLAIKKHH